MITSTTDAKETNADAQASDLASGDLSLPASAAMRTWQFLIVRHGETEWNAGGRIQGQLDISLSATGRAQAERLSRRFTAACRPDAPLPLQAALPAGPLTITTQFSSDLARAEETGRIIQRAVPSLTTTRFLTTPLLRERHFGEWQGLTADELRTRRTAHSDAPPAGETEEHVFDRMRQALNQMVSHLESISVPDKSVALVYGHGGSLRALLCLALGLQAADMHRFRLHNTSLSLIEITGTLQNETLQIQNGRLHFVNETAHLLPAELFSEQAG